MDELRAELDEATRKSVHAEEVASGQRAAAQHTLLAALDAREALEAQLRCLLTEVTESGHVAYVT